jgi:glyoxylase-like metal-dependent hydrolase (beta-lactamase superfamily II)
LLPVLTVAFPAAAFDTNCYVLAPAAGEECVIVDPGIGIEGTLAEVLAHHRLKPTAVLLTHGHLDHVYSVTPVSEVTPRHTSIATIAIASRTRSPSSAPGCSR